MEIVRGVERVAGRHHLSVVLSEMQGRRTPGRGWIEGVLARRPTGVIAVFSDLSETMRNQLRTRGIPFVILDPTGEPHHDTPSVGATNWNGGLTATRHLLALGPHADRGDRRARGHPVQPSSPRRVPGRDGRGRHRGRSGARQPRPVPGRGRHRTRAGHSCRCRHPPTAIVTGNDLQALGVYQVARELRLHIPEDVSVVGFDDLPVAPWVGPPLTTIRQPLRRDGRGGGRARSRHRRGERTRRPGRAVDRAHRPGEHRPTEP